MQLSKKKLFHIAPQLQRPSLRSAAPVGGGALRRPRLWSVTLVLTLFSILASLHATAASSKGVGAEAWAVQWQPTELVNGSPVIFEVTPPARVTRVSAKWLDHDVFLTYDKGTKTWYGMAGVSLETHPGTYLLELKGTNSRGAECHI